MVATKQKQGKMLPYQTIPMHVIIRRAKRSCWLCGETVSSKDASRDHVIPRSKGGPDKLANLRLAHASCNENRGNEDLISEEEARIIVLEGQGYRCQLYLKNGLTVNRSKIIVAAEYDNRRIRPVMIAVCLTGCKRLAKIPTQAKKTTGVDMGSDMVAADTLYPTQVEDADYIKFTLDGKTHEGAVLNIEDNGATFTITLSDENEGDAIQYVVDADTDIYLMMYDTVAV